MGRKRLLAMLTTTVLLAGLSAPAALAQTTATTEVPGTDAVEVEVDEDDGSLTATADVDTGDDGPVEETVTVEASADGVTADVEDEAAADGGDAESEQPRAQTDDGRSGRVSGASADADGITEAPAAGPARPADRLPAGGDALPRVITDGDVGQEVEDIPAPEVAPPAAAAAEDSLALSESEQPMVQALDAASPASPETVPTLLRILTLLLVAGAITTWRTVTGNLERLRP